MRPPEMVKRRPMVVISPRLRSREGVACVVPLSTSPRQSETPFHHKIVLEKPLPTPWGGNPFWAIGDHPMTVGLARLDLIRLGKDQYGKRRYYQHRLPESDLKAIREAILHGLGLGHLADFLAH